MRRSDAPPPFSPLDRVRVLLTFKEAGPGAVLDFDEDLMPSLPQMERHTAWLVTARLLNEVCLVPARGATAKPARYTMTAHGFDTADSATLELVASSEMSRRLLTRMGYHMPEPPVADDADAAPGARAADLVTACLPRRRSDRDGRCP